MMRLNSGMVRVGPVWIALCLIAQWVTSAQAQQKAHDGEQPLTLSTEQLSGEGTWVQPVQTRRQKAVLRAKVWFDRQFLGDGTSYEKRAKEFAGARRRQLREQVMQTLKTVSDESFAAAQKDLDALVQAGIVRNLERHWIINGFSCTIAPDALDKLKEVPRVKKIFLTNQPRRVFLGKQQGQAPAFEPTKRGSFDPAQYKHPWYVRYLMADKVWQQFDVTGRGTLNVIHDFNFVFSDNTTCNLYCNPGEVPANGKDDDGNGLVDDYHGYNFDRNTPRLTMQSVPAGRFSGQLMHGFMCSAIICGSGLEGKPYEFGIAPEASWTGVIGSQRLEAAVEWAVEQGADTYSMSFSIPQLGEYRSHWRKIMEHGSFCGVYFVSGAGNFAQQQPVPIQMRVPEDIPNVVFAAAGVRRNLERTPFSSKGPVEWATEHYKDGQVQKPEVCAFNMGLPILMANGNVQPTGLNGNSFAGPMFCGSIALMLSADPDLLPWDLKEIITSTATDVAAPGVDYETGHGLINCFRAVKEVLRRKAVRDNLDVKPYEGREPRDELDIRDLQDRLGASDLKVLQVQPGSQAARLGLKRGDVIVSYNGRKISNRQDLIRARKATPATEEKNMPLVITRDGESLEFQMGPGPFGFVPGTGFGERAFQ